MKNTAFDSKCSLQYLVLVALINGLELGDL